MYFAPHHSEGIGCALAEKPTGPWQIPKDAPILRLEQFPEFVEHISGPKVVWIPEENHFRMYLHGTVHGQGQQTGVAVSRDGLHFEPLYPGAVMPYPYLRVFRYGGYYYGVCRIENKLGLVRSEDGLRRTEWSRNPLLKPEAEFGEYDRIPHHCVHLQNHILYLYYCTYRDPGERMECIRLAVMNLSGDWENWQDPTRLGDVLTPSLPWEANNLRDPYIFPYKGKLLYYVGGNEAGIGLAFATSR